MAIKNRYYRRSRIASMHFRHIIRYFAMDFTASDTARLTGIGLRSIIVIYIKLRERLAEECDSKLNLDGEVEVDESYFGPRRVRGQRRRGAGGKTIVFGVLKRDGYIHTEIISDAKKATLRAVIRGRVDLNSVIHPDGWCGYHGLVDMGYQKHYRVPHGKNEFANECSHINGVESFWAFAKLRLIQFKGIRKHMFYYHLKETEFRFNHRHARPLSCDTSGASKEANLTVLTT